MSSKNYPALNRIALVRDFGINRYRTKQQFIDYLETKEHIISSRTLNRDFEFLRGIGYEVDYNSHEKMFIIRDTEVDKTNILDRALELEYLKDFKDGFSRLYKKYVIDGESKSEGIDMLRFLFKAIDEKLTISFVYHKFKKDKTNRVIAPLQLKVSQNRWYIIGFDVQKNALRVFGLDRVKDLKLGKQFKADDIPASALAELDLQKYYLGVTSRITEKERKLLITLGVSDFLIEYWKIKPIHFTQRITGKKSQGYNLVEFILVPNIDLVKLIVSSLGEVKLLGPAHLVERVKTLYGI